MHIRTILALMLALTCAFTGAAGGAPEDRAAAVLSAARQAIGGHRIESLKTFSLEASLQRNVNTVQLTADIEIFLDLPDRYVRSETTTGMMNSAISTGFNGDTPIRPANGVPLAGGGMMIRMGPGAPTGPAATLSSEEQDRADRQLLRGSRADISRLMLGWFAQAHPASNVEYTYAGEAESPDGKAYVIDAKGADGFGARLFIDQHSSLPLMVTYRAPQPRVVMQGGPRRAGDSSRESADVVRREMSEEERRKVRESAEHQPDRGSAPDLQSQPPQMAEFALYFDDWREVDGVKFPHSIRRAMNGSTNEEWTVRKIRVNPRVDPKKFEG